MHSSRVRMAGPLATHQDTIWTALLARGYTPLSARNLLRVAAHLSRWLEGESVSPRELTGARLDAFVRHRVACGYTCWLTLKGLEPILLPLRSRDVIPAAEPQPEDDSPLGRLLQQYQIYLLEDRGVVSTTAAHYLRTAWRFFADLGAVDLVAVRRLSTADISGFILRQARSSSVGTAKLTVTGLRSLLRFLHVRGLCGQLSAAVPAVAGHRLTRLPKYIPWEEIQQLLDSCDLRTAAGQRDHAILLLLVRLGLRAGEVAALELDDMHWASGEILVRGKGPRHGCLPLPRDVGEAIVRYLRGGRPYTTSRRLFVSSRAPHGDLRPGAINSRVRQASRRARLVPRSAHQLRHTAATQMLRSGASLQSVAEVLRHWSIDTTAIYAKVDFKALRPLARPWLGDGS